MVNYVTARNWTFINEIKSSTLQHYLKKPMPFKTCYVLQIINCQWILHWSSSMVVKILSCTNVMILDIDTKLDIFCTVTYINLFFFFAYSFDLRLTKLY